MSDAGDPARSPRPRKRGEARAGAGKRKRAATGRQAGRRKPSSTKAGTAGRASTASVRETRKEISAGGVVYRRQDGSVEVLLAARRTRRGDIAWGLAKGGIEPEESHEDAAVREVREETGIVAEIEQSLGEVRYFYVWDDVRVRKTVHFFLMLATGGDVADRDDEMEDVRWFALSRALRKATYRGEREVLQRAAKRLR